jgi:hypothetical protein
MAAAAGAAAVTAATGRVDTAVAVNPFGATAIEAGCYYGRGIILQGVELRRLFPFTEGLCLRVYSAPLWPLGTLADDF